MRSSTPGKRMRTTEMLKMMMKVTMISERTLSSSDRITSRISMCSNSFDTGSCGPTSLRQKSLMAIALLSPRAVIPSIQRAAEARHGNGHRKQHQGDQGQTVILQIRQACALEHDG